MNSDFKGNTSDFKGNTLAPFPTAVASFIVIPVFIALIAAVALITLLICALSVVVWPFATLYIYITERKKLNIFKNKSENIIELKDYNESI